MDRSSDVLSSGMLFQLITFLFFKYFPFFSPFVQDEAAAYPFLKVVLNFPNGKVQNAFVHDKRGAVEFCNETDFLMDPRFRNSFQFAPHMRDKM